MNLADVRRMLKIIPRYSVKRGTHHFNPGGASTAFNGVQLPRAHEAALRKAMDKHNPIDNDLFSVKAVDVASLIVRAMEMKMVNLQFLARAIDWQKWNPRAKEDKALPVVVKFAERTVLWNGIHRGFVCLMLGKRLRVRYVDLDAIVKAAERGSKKTSR